MWMAYQKYSETTDFSSGLKSLINQFSDLEFDADHESAYCLGSKETVENYLKLAKKYRKAKKLCSDCLRSKITVSKFVREMRALKLLGFLQDLKPFMEKNFQKELSTSSSSSSESSSSESEEEKEEIEDFTNI